VSDDVELMTGLIPVQLGWAPSKQETRATGPKTLLLRCQKHPVALTQPLIVIYHTLQSIVTRAEH
jgi:hypothetical protein